MKVVSNASPLITLSRVGQLESLRRSFPVVNISPQVYDEIVVAGAGKPGAAAVARADWIQVAAVKDVASIERERLARGLGAGEVSAVLLAKELNADLILMDEWKGRRFAKESGYAVVGCVGILEELYRIGEIENLPECYRELLRQGIRIDLRALQASLDRFQLPSL